MYDPAENNWQEGLPIAISKTLKRRYFLVEKAKNANVIGMPQHLPSWHQVLAQSILVKASWPNVLIADYTCSSQDKSEHILGL